MDILFLILEIINSISGLISSLFAYRSIYAVTGVFATRKFRKARCSHKYAILVAARNEEAVIGNLLHSIRMQDYPKELLTVFVVADNCVDSTAQIARQWGAVCYERQDAVHRTKGYALQYLVECIRRDYGIECFEGYFVFDADNLLKQDYIARMNEAFDAGQKIITSYRNTKNFGDNWISASYGVHWLRTARTEHRARSLFHLATRIQGTGFLFANELIKNGWNYVSLTEDRAFCADAIAQGYQISYNHDAEFYDEQPVDIKTAMRQRVRWAKGHLQAMVETGPTLLKHIFVTDGVANRSSTADTPRSQRLLNNLRLRFMSFDMLSVVYTRSLFTLFRRIVVYLLELALLLMGGAVPLRIFGMEFGQMSLESSIALLTALALWASVSVYFFNIFMAAYIYFIERKRIQHIPFLKKLWFCLTFPLFDVIGKLSLVIALFIKVDWKTIPHTSAVKITDLNPEQELQNL